jgi:hypothetical protein
LYFFINMTLWFKFEICTLSSTLLLLASGLHDLASRMVAFRSQPRESDWCQCHGSWHRPQCHKSWWRSFALWAQSVSLPHMQSYHARFISIVNSSSLQLANARLSMPPTKVATVATLVMGSLGGIDGPSFTFVDFIYLYGLSGLVLIWTLWIWTLWTCIDMNIKGMDIMDMDLNGYGFYGLAWTCIDWLVWTWTFRTCMYMFCWYIIFMWNISVESIKNRENSTEIWCKSCLLQCPCD